ncbi:glycosyltransferase [Aerosakkonemataceae cyanobacterium BLCC-F154]|uniref:Glycosyltransferase n=1 Tax=Floridaenema fluviatile BLCC-F154 TaxID=3153640 RepID=A0ABV4YM77_9CYAN
MGSHFARKGGIAVLRFAKKALQEGLPIKVKIISSLRLGDGVPTDVRDKSYYDRDLKLLDIENVSYYNQLPNQKVIELLHRSHFQIIPSLQDIAAFSVVEGLSTATPSIGSNIGAIPEWITDNSNGYIIDLPVDENQMWKGWKEQNQLSDKVHIFEN